MYEEDVAKLAGSLMSFAQQMLAEHGEFHPFAASVTGGQVSMVAADMGVEYPESNELISFLQSSLSAKARSGEIDASGICLNVRANLPGFKGEVDAVCFQVEHREGEPLQIFSAITKNWFGRRKFSAPINLPGQSLVFSMSGEA